VCWIPWLRKWSLTYLVLSGRSSKQIATTSAAKGGCSKKDVGVGVGVGVGGDPCVSGDEGGVFVACGVNVALDEIVDNELSDIWGEFVAPVPLYEKYTRMDVFVCLGTTER